MVELIITSGKHRNKKLRLPETEVVLGSNAACKIRLESKEISESHCSLTPTSNGWLVKDLDSRTGTTVNGAKIQQETVLQNGDLLKIGPVEFQFRDQQTASQNSGQQDDTTTDDDIADWLMDDKANEGPGGASADSDATTSKTRGFQSIAEEAEDIIRRYQDSIG